MNEDKATRYHRLGRRTGLFSTLWTGVALFGLTFSGSAAGLRDWASDLAGGHDALTVALFVLILAVGVELTTLPFSYYRGFVLERRYGLATESRAHWVVDHFKGVLIGLVIGEVVAIAVYETLQRWPDHWWIVAGTGYAATIVLLANLAPIVLLPLFYTFKPLEKAALHERLTAMASRAGARVIGVYEWTLSDRTRRANAALTGTGNTRRILLSDTLLSDYSDEEIEVILAHELSHHVHWDIWTSMLYDIVLAFGGCFAAHLVLRQAIPLLGLAGAADPAGLPVLLAMAGGVGLAVKPLMNAISRAHERRADAYALTLTNNPQAFISAMRRLGQQNLAEQDPSRLIQALFYTHPPIKERLRAAQDWASA